MSWREIFNYDPETGVLRNKVTRSSRAKAGGVAGNLHPEGYMRVGFLGKQYMAHRVIWEMHNGSIPDGMQIDHINGVRDDNRIANLRVVTHQENGRNQKMKADNTTGYPGVFWNKARGKYQAQIVVNGKNKHLGVFHTAERAYQAYLKACKEYGFHENHGRSH